MEPFHCGPVERFPRANPIVTPEKLQRKNGLVDAVSVDIHDR
jgi:hypothetical protein